MPWLVMILRSEDRNGAPTMSAQRMSVIRSSDGFEFVLTRSRAASGMCVRHVGVLILFFA